MRLLVTTNKKIFTTTPLYRIGDLRFSESDIMHLTSNASKWENAAIWEFVKVVSKGI